MTSQQAKVSVERLLRRWFDGADRVLWIGRPETRPAGTPAIRLDFLTVAQLFEIPPAGGSIEESGSTFPGNRTSKHAVPWPGGAIWCVAGEEIKSKSAFEIVCRLKESLPADGTLLVLWDSESAPDGLSSFELSLLVERLGFERSAAEADSGVQVFRRSADAGSRAVDRIESILSKDRKVATYKLALVRALAEIAQSAYHCVHWRGDKVLVPLDAIAERWLFYYWPIFADPEWIPQIQKEGQPGARSVRFRSSLTALITLYREQGGLSSFHASYFGDAALRSSPAVKKALRDISETIKTGPVAHAGGIGNPLFAMESMGRKRYVSVPCDIWRELTLLSAWIADAVVIRWIDKTVDLSGRTGHGSIIRSLLERPDPERTTALARQCYLGQVDLRCVWTNRAIDSAGMDVDHVIPYALWKNNDLWNLVPASSQVNARKSDLLPSRAILLESKPRIVTSWEWLRAHHEPRFDAELERVLGQSMGGDWRKVAFEYLQEAVEITATQRVVDRWPKPELHA